jgi:hypothetical protein
VAVEPFIAAIEITLSILTLYWVRRLPGLDCKETALGHSLSRSRANATHNRTADSVYLVRLAGRSAAIFPLILWGGGKVAGITLRDSMSAYYWATPVQPCPCGENSEHSCKTKASEVDLALTLFRSEKSLEPGTMRNWFVGLLFAIGTLLYVNHGHSRREDVALNFAGLLAVGTALLPMSWDCYHHSFSPYGFCAIPIFRCIAYVSAICSRDTLVLIKDPKVREVSKNIRRLSGCHGAVHGTSHFGGNSSSPATRSTEAC